MIEQVIESFRKSTENTLAMQQDMFRQWAKVFPVVPQPQVNGWTDQAKKFQSEWTKMATELVKKQQTSLSTQYEVGMKAFENALKVAEAKNPEEFRQRFEEMWRKNFESLKEMTEAQVREFQSAVKQWTELASKAG